MKKLLLVMAFFATVSAQSLPVAMPEESTQYVLSQRILSAIGGFQEQCDTPSEQVRQALSKVFAKYQQVCGGYFVNERPPLELIDAEMSEYEPREAWQRRNDTYVRVYAFGAGQLQVALLEYATRNNVVLISYQQYKPETNPANTR